MEHSNKKRKIDETDRDCTKEPIDINTLNIASIITDCVIVPKKLEDNTIIIDAIFPYYFNYLDNDLKEKIKETVQKIATNYFSHTT
jgi:hypothetical protein